MLDVDTFKNRVNNFLDHSNLGESNMYFPIAVDGALVRAWEMTLRSPALWRTRRSSTSPTRTRSPSSAATSSAASRAASPPIRPATSAPITRPSTTTSATRSTPASRRTCPRTPGSRPMSTTAPAFRMAWPARAKAPTRAPICPCTPPSMSPRATRSASTGSLAANVINVTNHRVLLDNSVTIGGFHYNDPRMISAELRYRFHF